MKMYHLIEWFQINYPQICTSLKNCSNNYKQSSIDPYHIESDCWSHTMMVCKISELENVDLSVQIAALLHDIGKPSSRKENHDTQKINFENHESISAFYALEILYTMLHSKMIRKHMVNEIFSLIALHSVLYNTNNMHQLFNKFKFNRGFYIKLNDLSKCDKLGRFSAEDTLEDNQSRRYENISKNMYNREVNSDKNNPVIEFMCGISQSGKSHYIAQKYEYFSGLILSYDNFVMKYGKGETYDECLRSLSDEDKVSIDKVMKKSFLQAIKEEKNILVDMMNLTIADRKMWLDKVSRIYTKNIKIFLTPLSVIKVRNSSDSGKKIEPRKIREMSARFEYPLYDEFNHIEGILSS